MKIHCREGDVLCSPAQQIQSQGSSTILRVLVRKDQTKCQKPFRVPNFWGFLLIPSASEVSTPDFGGTRLTFQLVANCPSVRSSQSLLAKAFTKCMPFAEVARDMYLDGTEPGACDMTNIEGKTAYDMIWHDYCRCQFEDEHALPSTVFFAYFC